MRSVEQLMDNYHGADKGADTNSLDDLKAQVRGVWCGVVWCGHAPSALCMDLAL